MSIARTKSLSAHLGSWFAVPSLKRALGILDALIDADRRFRERRRLEALEYPYLRDMGIDLGRKREEHRR